MPRHLKQLLAIGNLIANRAERIHRAIGILTIKLMLCVVAYDYSMHSV